MAVSNNNSDNYTSIRRLQPGSASVTITESFRLLQSKSTRPHGSRLSSLSQISKGTSRVSSVAHEGWSLGQAMDQLFTVSTSRTSTRRTVIATEGKVSPPPGERVKNSGGVEQDARDNTKRCKLSSPYDHENLSMDVNADAGAATIPTTSRSSAGATMQNPIYPLCPPIKPSGHSSLHIPDFDVTADQYLSQLTPKYAPELFVGLGLPGGVPVNFRWINTQTGRKPFSHSVIFYGECHERGRSRQKPIVYRN